MLSVADITGAILAGGKSSRMGTDKALLDFCGKPFIQHIAETLQSVFPQSVIISDRQKDYEFVGLPVFPDVIHDAGPLGGIHAALTHATTPMIFVLACDTPFVSPALMQEILSQGRPDTITVAKDSENTHPLIGIYPQHLLASLNGFLAKGHTSVHTFLHRHNEHMLVLDLHIFSDQLRNVNTQSDYRTFNC